MLVGLVPRVAAAAPQPLRAARAVGLADVGRRQIRFKRRGELARAVADLARDGRGVARRATAAARSAARRRSARAAKRQKTDGGNKKKRKKK